jgi:LysM repeat protein
MKLSHWMIASLLLTASPAAIANTELETLRSRCLEQERQIRHLEDENSKLRSLGGEQRSAAPAPTPAKTATEGSVGSSGAEASTYIVKPGDNLEKIARQLRVSSAQLAKTNGLKGSSVLHPGQKLKVPGKVGTATATPSEAPVAAPAQAAATPSSSTPRTHKVRANETYSSISRKYKISADTLIAANPKVKPTSLREGQVINLERQVASPNQATGVPTPAPAPVPVPAPPAAETVVAPVASLPTPEPQQGAGPSPQAAAEVPAKAPGNDRKVRPIVIEEEMTYGDFAIKHGTDAERLNALNGLDLTPSTVLAKGSELYVPGN